MFNFNFLFQLFNRPRRISWTRWLRCTSPSGLAKISSLSRVKTPRCCGPIWPTNCQIRSLFRSTLTKASFQKCERKLRKEVENWLIMTRRDITFRHYRQIPTEMRPNMQGITPMKWSLSHSMFGGIISLVVEFGDHKSIYSWMVLPIQQGYQFFKIIKLAMPFLDLITYFKSNNQILC